MSEVEKVLAEADLDTVVGGCGKGKMKAPKLIKTKAPPCKPAYKPSGKRTPMHGHGGCGN